MTEIDEQAEREARIAAAIAQAEIIYPVAPKHPSRPRHRKKSKGEGIPVRGKRGGRGF